MPTAAFSIPVRRPMRLPPPLDLDKELAFSRATAPTLQTRSGRGADCSWGQRTVSATTSYFDLEKGRPSPGDYDAKVTRLGREFNMADLNGAELMPTSSFMRSFSRPSINQSSSTHRGREASREAHVRALAGYGYSTAWPWGTQVQHTLPPSTHYEHSGAWQVGQRHGVAFPSSSSAQRG